MEPWQWQRARELHAAALETGAEDHEAFLQQHAEEPAAVLECLRRALGVHERASGFLETQHRGAVADVGAAVARARIPDPDVSGRWEVFQILELLGEGSFGRVYRAHDAELDREFALKLVPRGAAPLREARALASLDHPNIVTVFGIRETAGAVGICMQLIDGENLDALVKRKRLTAAETIQAGIALADALHAMHTRGILHCDVKAQNVRRRNSDGCFFLMDFGLADQATVLRESARFAGTLPYMAPELLEEKPCTTSTDVYALGVLLYHALTGEYPVRGLNPAAFREEHRTGRAVRLGSRGRFPPRLVRTIEAAIDPNPARRTESAAALRDALRKLAPGRRVRWVVAAGLLGAAAASALIWRPAEKELVLSRVTSGAGLDLNGSLSADGKLLAYASDENGPGDLNIQIRSLADGRVTRLTHDALNESEPAISPDGSTVVYRSEREGGQLMAAAVTGGAPRRLAASGYDPHFSPDGKRVVYWTGQQGLTPEGTARCFVIALEGGAPERVAGAFADARYPAWTPDGRIIFQARAHPSETEADELWITRPGSHEASSTGLFRTLRAAGIKPFLSAVVASGNFLTLAAGNAEFSNIWQVRADGSYQPAGTPLKRTYGSALEMTPGVSANGAIAFESMRAVTRVYGIRADAPAAERKTADLTGAASHDTSPAIDAAGDRIVFRRFVDGKSEIRTRDLRSGQERVVTSNFNRHLEPAISDDGTVVAFTSVDAQGEATYTQALDGVLRRVRVGCGRVAQFAGANDRLLFIACDGRVVVIDAGSGDTLGTVLRSAGTQITRVALSPDGRDVAWTTDRPDGLTELLVARTIDGGLAVPAGRRIGAPGGWSDRPQWSRDGKWIYFLSNTDGFVCVWRQRIRAREGVAAAEPEAFYHFHQARFSPVHVGRRSMGLAVSSGMVVLNSTDLTGNIWMLRPRED